MTRRRFLGGALMLSMLLASGAMAAEPCPACGAALEAGAAFCSACGAPVAAPPARPAPPAPGGAAAPVVRVVAAHDSELTSTFGAIAYGSKVEIDSILGTAFAWGPREFVTDAGLLMGARSVSLIAPDGRSASARVVGIDEMIGVALLEADLGVGDAPPRRAALPRVGESVTAVGFPSARRTGREAMTTPGVVSGLHRGDMRIHPVEDYIQTDATLPDGFAGGPALDSDGNLIGMSTAWLFGSIVVLGPDTGIGVLVPTGWIERSLSWIRAGAPPRGWIGAHTLRPDENARLLHGTGSDVPRVIRHVFPGSPAESAGLRAGDGLLRLGGKPAGALAALHGELLAGSVGDIVTLDVKRGAETLSVPVTLGPRPSRPRLAGLDALRLYGGFDAEAGPEGYVVTKVLPGSAARAAKLTPGDLLLSVLCKTDLDRSQRDNARWRSVKSDADLESRMNAAYSQFDFFVGLRFRGKDGERRELFLRDLLTPTSAL